MKHLLTSCLLVALAAFTPARADIEKLAQPCGEKMCFHWWPRLQELKGWQHDRPHSLHYGANALAPTGFTFANSEAVIYARALYKPRMPELKTLSSLIANDQTQFKAHSSGIIITEAGSLTSADNQKLQTFTFFPSKAGNWERVAYGEEGEFYLLFTLSARSEAAYLKALPAYEALIGSYREKQP